MCSHIIAIVILSFVGVSLIATSGLYALAKDDDHEEFLCKRFETMSNLIFWIGLSAWTTIGLNLFVQVINLELVALLYTIFLLVIAIQFVVKDAPRL